MCNGNYNVVHGAGQTCSKCANLTSQFENAHVCRCTYVFCEHCWKNVYNKNHDPVGWTITEGLAAGQEGGQ